MLAFSVSKTHLSVPKLLKNMTFPGHFLHFLRPCETNLNWHAQLHCQIRQHCCCSIFSFFSFLFLTEFIFLMRGEKLFYKSVYIFYCVQLLYDSPLQMLTDGLHTNYNHIHFINSCFTPNINNLQGFIKQSFSLLKRLIDTCY